MAVSCSRVLPSTTFPKHVFWGHLKVTLTEVTFDSSYPTGGEPLTASDLGLNAVHYAFGAIQVPGGTATACVKYDNTNAKLLVYNTTAQVSAATDLSALVVMVIAFGQ